MPWLPTYPTVQEMSWPKPCCNSRLHFWYWGVLGFGVDDVSWGGEKPATDAAIVVKLAPESKPARNLAFEARAAANRFPGWPGVMYPGTVLPTTNKLNAGEFSAKLSTRTTGKAS